MFRSLLTRFVLWTVGLTAIGGVALYIWIDHTVDQKFNNRLWDIPVHIYGSTFEIYPGLSITPALLEKRLISLGYRHVARARDIGEFRVNEAAIELVTRPFEFWDGPQPARAASVAFDDNKVRAVTDRATGGPISLLRLKPHLIGSLSQGAHQDRYLVRLDDFPRLLLETLLAVEDQRFVKHWGVDPWAILRAAVANMRAGRIVQGGSTLTQQLVKNVYGRDGRTYTRKLLEAATALVLEFRLDKRQILEAYCNEVFLGQDGKRAIHGFGLGSQHLFGRPVAELNPNEIAQLVGMIKAPSAYNPRRRPESAQKRRQVVLAVMKDNQLISEAEYETYSQAPLLLHTDQSRRRQAYSSFVDVVFRQLSDRLDAKDLRSSALSIFTTMDLEIQGAAEVALAEELTSIESRMGLTSDSLEGAIVVLRPDTGEIVALVGSRNAYVGAFNRALSARRPVGSLIKPFIYLSAFMNDASWTLATVVSDQPVTYRFKGSPNWAPKNFDEEFLGDVTILEALAKSRNVPAVKVGMKIGVDRVADNLRNLGADIKGPVYPSLLLGALEMSPLEVARVYQVLANFGFQSELRTISAITTDARSINRTRSSSVQAVLPPMPTYLALYGMQEVVKSGTGRGLQNTFNHRLQLAGKTGTTNGFRDSWFVGMSGNLLGVVWVGRDDNKPTDLTGASGALRIWANMMKRVNLQALKLPAANKIQFVDIDLDTGLKSAGDCERVSRVPFLAGSVPNRLSSCP